jgi:hypothetical protein
MAPALKFSPASRKPPVQPGLTIYNCGKSPAGNTVFLIGYTRFKDIPPLVFYLLLIVVGAVLV